jgi:hypothetical protein
VISVSDGHYRTSLPAFSIKVLPLPNNPPTISGTPAASVAASKAYSFQPTAKDPNGLKLTFGIWGKPAWASFDATTGRLYGTPGTSSVGKYSNIAITAYDGYSKAVLPAFSVTVTGQAPPPPVSTGSATLDWMPPTQNTDGTTLTDLAGYHLYYGTTAANLDHSVNIANPGLASYVISNLSPATWYFSMTAYNTSGTESDRSAVASIVTQ